MRILFLVPSVVSGKGGIQTYTNFVIKALCELNIELSVISLSDRSDLCNQDYLFYPCAKIKYLSKSIFAINAIAQAIKFKPDIILCGHVHFLPICYLIKKIFRVPYFVITYGIEIRNLCFLEAWYIKQARKIFSISRFTKDCITKQIYNYDTGLIRILPNTSDQSRFQPKGKPLYLMKRLGIDKEEKIILTICRLAKSEKYKGYDKVIMAFKNISQQFPKLKYIIGGSGDDLDRIKRIIKDNHLEAKIILPGFVPEEELPDYYNLCDVFIMPSLNEGFGIVFLEALSCGKPVIAGDKDGSSDALLDGELGLLIDPLNLGKITKALVDVLTKQAPARIFDKEYLRRRVCEEYNFDKFKEKLKIQMDL